MKRIKQAGFTLIELVVVMVILGILAAVAVPQFVNLQASAYAAVEESACGAIMSQATLLYASNRAIPTDAVLDAAIPNIAMSKVSVTSTAGSCTYTVQATGNTGTTTCTVPTTLCQ